MQAFYHSLMRLSGLAALSLAISWSALAAPVMPLPVEPGALCRPAVALAEQAHGIPSHLLAAISRVESGRRDPVSGNVRPWPWTVNAEGQGSFYDSKAQAIAAVRDMQAHGIRSIDIGCTQVNLMHHPDAFASLEQAFDPQTNANYAATFLTQLFGQTADWARAAALYHSATPELGADYQKKVMAAWPEETRLAGTFATAAVTPLARAWSATLPTAPGRLIMLPANGATMQGRSLAAYRAAPIMLARQFLRP